ncbi:MAG: hypothetical protein IMZ61_05755 [Planctomycetes bacterium]|nr:hypothetical protein [Planctomycetota bacterium]
MSSKRTLVPNKPRRLPRKGFLFTFVRFAGLLLKGAGLLLGIAVIGFFIMLVRFVPTLVGSIRYLDQKMAGFIFLISLGYLLIFPIVGLVGVAIAGIGLALGYVGTEPAMSTSIIRPDQVQISQLKQPPTKGAG